MLALRFRLLAGRVHATGWDHHVNEGVVEWPPSPWRLLRALAAGAWRAWPHGPPAELRQALERLASQDPSFQLPPATFAHTRQYMPAKGADWSPLLVFDAFAVTSKDAELVAAWDLRLDDAQASALARAAEGVSYLGRAEAWAEAIVDPEWGGTVNAVPLRDGVFAPEAVRLLAPMSRAEVEAEHARLTAGPGGKKSRPPRSVWDALQVDTARLRKDAWSRAPGTRWARYRIAPQETPSRPIRRRASPAPSCVLFSVWSVVPPRVEDSLALGETFRGALNWLARDVAELHGRDGEGAPHRGDTHARYLCLDLDGDGCIDHALLHAPGGLPEKAMKAVADMSRMELDLRFGWRREGAERSLDRSWPIRLTPLQAWSEAELSLARDLPLPLRSSSRWVSATPFLLTRHTKQRGRKHGPEAQIRRELGLRFPDWPELVDLCEVTGAESGGRTIPWRDFRRRRLRRPGNARCASTRGYGFELRFAEPVSGPLALGALRNFGLGLFLPR